MLASIPDVKAWVEKRLIAHRQKLECFDITDIETNILRARIAECTELLEALNNKAPPVLSFASEL